MKILAILLLAASLWSCSTEKDLQVKMVSAELVKIDIVQRSSAREKVLTWRTSENVQYVSFEPVNNNYKVGLTITAMVRR